MDAQHPDGIPQIPQPDEGGTPRSGRGERSTTATAPDSVEKSVYEEAEHAGTRGTDAADPPNAAGKSPDGQATDPAETASHLDPDEAARVRETREEARRVQRVRDQQFDDGKRTSTTGTY
ncbi:hypothetical protein [Leucobacter sp. GX24907]